MDDGESSSAADALVAVFESICLAQQAARGGEGSVSAATASAPSPQLPSPPSEEMGSASGSLGAPSMADAGSGAASSSASTAGEHVAGLGGSSSGPASVAASTQSLRPVEARLLVDSALVGYLVGRGGGTIKDTMARSGAGVRVLPKPELPPCACVGDEVVRVCGSAGAVGAALRLLAGQIKAHPLRLGSLPYAAPGSGHAPPLMLAQATHADLAYMHPSLGGYFAHAAAAPGAGGMVGAPVGSAGGFGSTQVEVTFRLLAPTSRTGNIIGKGGEHVRRVRQETGARIKVGAGPAASRRVSGSDQLGPAACWAGRRLLGFEGGLPSACFLRAPCGLNTACAASSPSASCTCAQAATPLYQPPLLWHGCHPALGPSTRAPRPCSSAGAPVPCACASLLPATFCNPFRLSCSRPVLPPGVRPRPRQRGARGGAHLN